MLELFPFPSQTNDTLVVTGTDAPADPGQGVPKHTQFPLLISPQSERKNTRFTYEALLLLPLKHPESKKTRWWERKKADQLHSY